MLIDLQVADEAQENNSEILRDLMKLESPGDDEILEQDVQNRVSGGNDMDDE